APSKKPVGDKPPAARKPKAKPGCTEKFVGKPAKRAEVKAALTEAAGRTYWPVSAPGLTVPLDLVKAVAWQESTWRSNVHSCDGGVGLMQVMPGTAKQVNDRFEKAYDLNVHTDNAVLGANYLAWLVKYYGDAYFEGNYEAKAADCASTTDMCLLNMVISAYNFGPGAVDEAADNNKALPNPGYVKNVRRLMTQCECLSF
ncbi:MAG TPA: transglycosylase SLT domain-containing protein, partial [Catenuloplanes sp.]